MATLIILEALSWTFRWSPCFYLISVLLFFFIPWSFAFHYVEKGPSNSLPKGGNMEETGAIIAEYNVGGTGEFEGEDEIDWEEGWDFSFSH